MDDRRDPKRRFAAVHIEKCRAHILGPGNIGPLDRTERKEMKLSARNQIKGKIGDVQKGQKTGHVRIDIGNRVIITSSITNEAIDDLALQVGEDATAVIIAGSMVCVCSTEVVITML
jgi:molybdopterin-binding protein